MHPVLTEKFTLDRADIMFLWNYTSFIIVLNNNSHPQPQKGRFMLDKNLVPKISKFHVSMDDKDSYFIRPWVLRKK